MAKRSKAIVELKKFLKQHGWEYLPDDEQPMLRGLMTGDNGQWHWVATQTHDDRFLMFCSVSPVKVPPKQRAAVAEYLTHQLVFPVRQSRNGLVGWERCVPDVHSHRRGERVAGGD